MVIDKIKQGNKTEEDYLRKKNSRNLLYLTLRIGKASKRTWENSEDNIVITQWPRSHKKVLRGYVNKFHEMLIG